MRTGTFTTTTFSLIFLLLISQVQSLIHSISAPTKVLHPGERFIVTFHTTPYIQSNHQFYALFGIGSFPAPAVSFLGLPIPAVAPVPGADGGLGLRNLFSGPSGKGKAGIDIGGIDLWEANLGNVGSLKGFNVTLRLPVDLTLGTKNRVKKVVLQTGVLGMVGASGLTTLSFFNTTINIKSP
ncbi:uncharacterized protein EI90DRAFT_2204352 [Cantharellus anzutake]|uniref:uncharacterized protein n=1 Tax=Cantharellus anzutake TaxID=1750568 RepID=UPI0019057AD7|nr:uncharacterized protein EI90DRAFT_2204352 [Cantharellus anzutake]KAF8324986.1 hypothetical protein EI90DRAFT_2204352 [Cantharellus anzutake]